MSELINHPGVLLTAEFAAAQMPQYVPQAASSAGLFIDKFRAMAVETTYAENFKVVSTVSPGFERHCAAEFEHLAQTAPVRLVALAQIEFASDPVLLALAAEALALSTVAGSSVVGFLRSLLAHQRPFVREAAIHGLAPFIEANVELRQTLEQIARLDSSPGVRDAAGDVLALG